MFKRLLCTLFCFFLLASEQVVASQYVYMGPAQLLEEYDTIFVAFILGGRFVQGEGPNDCGWVKGSFDIVEELKGSAEIVNNVHMELKNCHELKLSVADSSDRFPIGKFVLLMTNDRTATIDSFGAFVWNEIKYSCVIDDIRRELGLSPPSDEVRERCIENEKKDGMLSYIDTLRWNIATLESRKEDLSFDLQEYKKELSSIESSVRDE